MPFFLMRFTALIAALVLLPGLGADEPVPVGSPLIKSPLETAQPIPLAVISPDEKIASCVEVKLHWSPRSDSSEATGFNLDVPTDAPTTSLFLAQLWKASLASAIAWQQPWIGANWYVLQTPTCDGTGIDAGLAVGMLITSARRAYPAKTVVIGNLNPDGSIGPVSHLLKRLQAVSASGYTRVVIPSVQQFDLDENSGQKVNVSQLAQSLHLETIPVTNLIEATEKTSGDPLPEAKVATNASSYNVNIRSLLEQLAKSEEDDAMRDLKFAPTDAELSRYSPDLAPLWKSVRAYIKAGQQAYLNRNFYAAFLNFSQANARQGAINAEVLRSAEQFNLQDSLAQAEAYHKRLQDLLVRPPEDHPDLAHGLIMAELAERVYDINVQLEGAMTYAKQAFSQRTDATPSQQTRARHLLLIAMDETRYLLDQPSFSAALAKQIDTDRLVPVENRAGTFLPQLIPVQIAQSHIFTEGLRHFIQDFGDELLNDFRLCTYIRVMRENKAAWDTLQHQREIAFAADASAKATDSSSASTPSTDASSPNAQVVSQIAFDPGTTFAPPRTVVFTAATKTLSDVALCLSWVNDTCEIGTLDQKYLHLGGSFNSTTHQWKITDRAQLDGLLQNADESARRGLEFASKAGVDTTVLSLVYERASAARLVDDDDSSLEALRNYWRCALLGEMCSQLAFTPKAKAVENESPPPAPQVEKEKPQPSDTHNVPTAPVVPEIKDKPDVPQAPAALPLAVTPAPATATPAVPPKSVAKPPATPPKAIAVVLPPTLPVAPAVVETNTAPAVVIPSPAPAPVTPAAIPVALPVDTNSIPVAPAVVPTAPKATAVNPDESTIPVAPAAHPDDGNNKH